MRINNAGHYEYCRWADKSSRYINTSIHETSPQEFFQKSMQAIRDSMLAGESVPGCVECYQMERHSKVSGRQRQLLKIGVRVEQFDKTLASSPWVPEFAKNDFKQLPQDWQIDLGNYCNSACVFCAPDSSSRLAIEHQKLGLLAQAPLPNWTDDPVLVQRFIDTLTQSPHIQYLHFIGGETLITPAFKTILQALIQSGLNHTATIGLATNLTVWKEDVIGLLTQFPNVNLGMSVESFTTTNDYVRWPSQLPELQQVMDRWIELARHHNWFIQFRPTPTILTIEDLLSVHEYAWANDIAVESCNFLQRPAFMRASVLPLHMRMSTIDRMRKWIESCSVELEQVVNTRNPNFAKAQVVQDLTSYVSYLEQEPDESWRLPDLVKYLKQLESLRGTSVLTYLPHYEELFRTAGY